MRISGKGLGVEISGRAIFHSVDVETRGGEAIAIVGASGSGKTTLLNCLGLLMKPTHGEVLVDDRAMSSASQHDILGFWRKSAAFVYQDSGVIDEESVAYNVTLSRGGGKQGDRSVDEVLERVGLGGRSRERAAALSGGEKQRLGIARAIFKRAEVVFADEPTASLDEGNRHMVRGLLLERARQGACVIVSTHDLDLARACDAVLSL